MYMYHLWAAGFIRILCNWLVPPVSGVPGWKHPQMVLRGYVLVDSLRREGEGEGGRGRVRIYDYTHSCSTVHVHVQV